MKKAVIGITSTLGVLATVATVIMMIGIAIDVFYRTLYGRSVPGILELSETALVAAVFLGMSYTGATNSHIGVDLLTERMPAKVNRWLLSIAWGATSAFLVWMIWATTVRAIASTESHEIRMGLVNWPIWPSRWIIVVGLVAMLLVSIVNLIRVASGREVLGIDEQMPDVVVHHYEYVTQGEDAPVSATTTEEGQQQS
ncbi:TRAP-type C4-dicarboxylate transport system, small permease component [Ruaniaceae bacterium KH17]|nr:TRAP-type C4-dicarboxylate transport system, small permease component [Ruaniaceae bacterium KH17]